MEGLSRTLGPAVKSSVTSPVLFFQVVDVKVLLEGVQKNFGSFSMFSSKKKLSRTGSSRNVRSQVLRFIAEINQSLIQSIIFLLQPVFQLPSEHLAEISLHTSFYHIRLVVLVKLFHLEQHSSHKYGTSRMPIGPVATCIYDSDPCTQFRVSPHKTLGK